MYTEPSITCKNNANQEWLEQYISHWLKDSGRQTIVCVSVCPGVTDLNSWYKYYYFKNSSVIHINKYELLKNYISTYRLLIMGRCLHAHISVYIYIYIYILQIHVRMYKKTADAVESVLFMNYERNEEFCIFKLLLSNKLHNIQISYFF